MFVNSPPLSILVIEDNPADFFLLGEYLAESTIKTKELVCAENLAEAFRIIREKNFDAVLLDLSLPDAIPTQTFSRIKPHFPDTPIIVLSGMDAVELAQQSLIEGAQDYLIKDKLDSTMLTKSLFYSIQRVKHTRHMMESERRFSQIASQFPNGIIAVIDKSFRFLFAVGGETTGIGSVSLTHTCFTDLFPASEAERIQNLLNEAFEGASISFEIQYADQYYQVSTAYMDDKKNQPESLLIVLQNITEVKKTATQLRFQSEVLSNITDGVIVTDENNKIVYWNRAATEIFGYENQEALGNEISLLTSDSHDLPEQAAIEARLQQESACETTVQLKTKSGERVWIELKISRNTDTSSLRPGLIYVLKDVNERKAEEHLLTLFQSVILNTSDAVIITEALPDRELNGRKIIFTNRAFTLMTGYEADEVIGKTAQMFMAPDTDPEKQKQIASSLNNWEPSQNEVFYRRKDGKTIWVTMAATPVSDNRGRFTNWVFIQRDNTESRKIAAALQSQNEELIKTNRELDRFVYSASHDLRAPLTSILGLITLMKIDENKNDILLYTDKIRESVNRLDRLIQNIINYSRNSRLAPVLKEIDFETILRTSIEMHEFAINHRFVNYSCKNKLNTPFLCDPERWQIILNNLVSNSMKFSKPDTNTEIKVLVTEKDHQLLFVYEDNGFGIQQNQIEHIFEMFYRATEVASGSGLGLYIVKQTVEILGGIISVESKTGEFTRFIISLPISKSEGGYYAEKSH